MKAAVFYKPGGPEQIQIVEVPGPEVDQHQVLIKVKACALNHFDLLVLREADPETTQFPFWGGADIAGVVAEVGSSVKNFKLGERVTMNPSLYCGECEFCIGGQESQCNDYGIVGDSVPGGMAEYIVVDAKDVMMLPDTLSFEAAAAATFTSNRGVDVVVENIGAATWAESLKSLVKGDRLVTYGRTSGSIAEADIRLIFWHHLRIIGSTMANRREFAEVMKLIFEGRLLPVVDSVYPLSQADKAYQHLLDGNQFGKVVISMEVD